MREGVDAVFHGAGQLLLIEARKKTSRLPKETPGLTEGATLRWPRLRVRQLAYSRHSYLMGHATPHRVRPGIPSKGEGEWQLDTEFRCAA